MKINEVRTSKFVCQRQWLLYKMAKARAAIGVVIGVKHNSHHGWLQTYQLRGVETGDNADRRMRELRNLQHFPIVMEKIEILVHGKKRKVPHFCLNCDPNTLDWDEICEQGSDYVWKRRPVEFRLEYCEEQGCDWYVDSIDLEGHSSAIDIEEILPVIELAVNLTLESMQEIEPDKYEKFIKKYNPNDIREIKT